MMVSADIVPRSAMQKIYIFYVVAAEAKFFA